MLALVLRLLYSSQSIEHDLPYGIGDTIIADARCMQLLPEAWKRRPSSATAPCGRSRLSSSGITGVGSRYMEPSRKQWEQGQRRPLKGRHDDASRATGGI